MLLDYMQGEDTVTYCTCSPRVALGLQAQDICVRADAQVVQFLFLFCY